MERAARGRGGGAGRHLAALQQPYFVTPSPYPYPTFYGFPHSLQYPLYPPLPLLTHHSIPTYHHTLPYFPPSQPPPFITTIDDELPWLQQLHQSDRELCDDVLLGRVCGEIVESVIPAMTRDVVIDTVNDIVQSYIGHQWVTGRVPETSPAVNVSPSLPSLLEQPNTEPLQQREVVTDQMGLHLAEVSPQAVGPLIIEQLLFTQLLTSELDSGAAMATRRQSTHILTEILFNRLLTKLITACSTH